MIHEFTIEWFAATNRLTYLRGNVWQIRPDVRAPVVEVGAPGAEAPSDEDVRLVQVDHTVFAEGLQGQDTYIT